MKELAVIVSCLLIISCNSNSEKQNKSASRIENVGELIPEPDVNLRLEFEKKTIDSTIIKGQKPISYVLIDEKQKAIQSDLDGNKIENYEAQYLIYLDSTKAIKAISEIPFSQSGDWYLKQIYYFDNQNRTFGIQKNFNTFQHDEKCGGGEAIFVNTVQFYDKGKQIGQNETVRDKKNNDLSKDSCGYFKIKMPFYANVFDLLDAAKIDLKENRK